MASRGACVPPLVFRRSKAADNRRVISADCWPLGKSALTTLTRHLEANENRACPKLSVALWVAQRAAIVANDFGSSPQLSECRLRVNRVAFAMCTKCQLLHGSTRSLRPAFADRGTPGARRMRILECAGAGSVISAGNFYLIDPCEFGDPALQSRVRSLSFSIASS